MTVTLKRLRVLQQLRQLGGVHLTDYRFLRVDPLLARMQLVLMLAEDDSVGPTLDHAITVVEERDYQEMVLTAANAHLHDMPPGSFDVAGYLDAMHELARAVGVADLDWRTL